MKKLLLITLCLFSITLIFTSCGKKSDAPAFNYTLKEDGTYAVSILDGATDKKLTIPSSYQGVAVTEISSDRSTYINAKSITIPDSITTIGEYAFSYCYNLKKISIPDSVKTIGEGAFYNCEKLKSVDLPDGLTSIGDLAFDECYKLKKINIPSSVTHIGDSVFYEASDKLKCEEYNNAYYLGNQDNPYMYLFRATSSDIDFSIIHKDTKFIGSSAFDDCSKLTSIIIPDGVTRIGSYAFDGCSKLKNIVIPTSVSEIANGAFYDCDSIETISLPDTITYLGNRLFYSCNSLKSVTIPDGVISIGDYAFYSCSKLESIIIPDSVTSFGTSSFGDCPSLKYNEYGNIYHLGNNENPYIIIIKAKDSSITSCTVHKDTRASYSKSFSDCNKLKAINVEEGNEVYKSVDGNLYTKDGKKLIQYAIGKLDSSFTIPDDVEIISQSAFANCTTINNITIPDSVTNIRSYAFHNCENLRKITIGNSVTKIDADAFEECKKLQGVYITDLAAWCGISYYNEYSNPIYCAKNLYVNGELVKDLVIPDGVTAISARAFENCDSITSVTIPGSVTSVGQGAFSSCTALTSVTLGSGMTTIGTYMFGYCENLLNVTIPESVTTIEGYAFYNCSSLPLIIIPDSVTYIGGHAFYGCDELKAVVFENPDDWGYLMYYYRQDMIRAKKIRSKDLENPSTAAQYLTVEHAGDDWYQGYENISYIKFATLFVKNYIRYTIRRTFPSLV